MYSLKFSVQPALLLLCLVTAPTANCLGQAAEQRPNLIVVMVDDMGYEGISCFGNPYFETPQIDRLAAEGMRLLDFHSSGTVCSPTRAGLLTGRYQQRAGIEAVIHPAADHPEHRKGLQLDEVTFAELLSQVGYHTALLGKWHQGYPHNSSDYHPQNHGFAEFVGYHSGNIDFISHVGDHQQHDWWYGRHEVHESGYSTHLINQQAVDFVRRQAGSEQPFCLYIAHEAIHNPVQVPGDPVRRTEQGWERWKWQDVSHEERIAKYRGMTKAIDEGIGQLRQTLEELSLADNTLVLFFSDNGPSTDFPSGSPKLRGQKGSVYEGGHKVPAIAWWPGHIPAGSSSNQPAITLDVMPTLLGIAGLDIRTATSSRPLDGVDLTPTLLHQEPLPERPLYWASLSNGGARAEALRSGEWKLVVRHPQAAPGTFDNPILELYNLRLDPSEQLNVAEEEPERAKELWKQFQAWYAETQATASKQPGGWMEAIPAPVEPQRNDAHADESQPDESRPKRTPATTSQNATQVAESEADLIESITKRTLRRNREGKGTTWFHPRACVVPTTGRVLMTMQPIEGSDYFGPVHWCESSDDGQTWSEPIEIPAFTRIPVPGHDGLTAGVCDVTPQYHPQTDTVIALGHVVFYKGPRFSRGDQLARYPVYAIRNSDGQWSERKILQWDDPRGSFIYSNNCGQRVVMPNGDVMMSFTFGPEPMHRSVAGVRCTFDGRELKIAEIGPPLTSEVGRGLLEPSLTRFKDQFWLTIRAEDGKGYVATSADGLNYQMNPWKWDDGQLLEMSTTQQHWLTHSDALYLVYTRRDAINENVIRWRSPLWTAQVDPERGCLIRATERIVLPLVGDGVHQPDGVALMGNFDATNVSPLESWVTVGEWLPRRGAVGDLLLAQFRWRAPNTELPTAIPKAESNKSSRLPASKSSSGPPGDASKTTSSSVSDASTMSIDTSVNSAVDESQTDPWIQTTLEGWQVYVRRSLRAESQEELQVALRLLERQLAEIKRVVPPPSVERLQQVALWISPTYRDTPPRAEYHPHRQWLKRNGRDPAMAKGIEFTNVAIFEAETRRMPNFALHELAHAFHDQVVGFDEPRIRDAYARAVVSGAYKRVERKNARNESTFERAYALTNPKEYFAEATEAYFSRNDFFPFDRQQLSAVDPTVHRLLEQLWTLENDNRE